MRKLGTTALGGMIVIMSMVASTAQADPGRIMSGGSNGLTWTAQSTIVGQKSTATVASGGSPAYVADPSKTGVVALIMNYATGSFICSGSLLSDRVSILTAGHCVSDGSSKRPLSTTAYFYNGTNPDTVVTSSPFSTPVSVLDYYVNPLYTGQVVDQNDIAVLRIPGLAPDYAKGYELYAPADLTGKNYTIDGYGQRSDSGGSVGANLGTGRLREGENRYDFRFGDPQFGGYFTDKDANGENFFGTADIANSFISDFDNGTTTNDASCALGGAFQLTSSQFCNVGVGLREVSSAGGDSGGPQFIDGKIASVTSFGLVFGGRNLGADYVPGLQSSWGEFNGFAPVASSLDFIRFAQAVPEPSTWLTMIMGFGLIGGILRREPRRAGALAA